MKDIEKIMESADKDIRTFEQLMDIVVEKLICGALMLREREVSVFLSRAEMALADYRMERSTQMDADIGMTILRDLISKYI